MSATAVIAFGEWLQHTRAAGRNDFVQLPPEYLACPPDAMLRVLDQVRERCSSMVGYGRTIGVDFDTIEALHRHLLE